MAQAYYSPETVQTGQVPATQTDFPRLISVTDARLKTIGNGGHVASANGYDIRPYSDSSLSTALTFELEYYNASTGQLVMWVKIPSLADGNIVYLGYGDTSLTTDGSSSSTWDSDFAAVYHLQDTSHKNDSTSNGRNLTSAVISNATGKIDGAVSGAGGGGGTYTSSFSIGANRCTFSAWIFHSDLSGNGVFIEKETINAQPLLFISGGNVIWRDGGVHDITHAVPSNSAWHYIVGTIAASNAGALYIDPTSSTPTATGSSSSFTDTSSALNLGSYDKGAGYGFAGSLDEVRVSKIARSGNWILTEYNNQSAPGTFATLGTEVAVGASTGLFVPANLALGAGGPFFSSRVNC